MSPQRVLLIIPCYNEEDAIANLLEEVAACNVGYETVVIDDGSHDSTYEIANRHSPTIKMLRNLGIGGAVQTGIEYAQSHGFDFCVQIDGDGQHPVDEVIKLLRAYEQAPSAITIGSRYLLNDAFRSTWARRFGGGMIAWTLNLLFPGNSITDPTSGMRLLDRKAIEFFAQRYPHDFPEPISLAWALKERLSVSEVAVKMRPREYGRSSIVGWKPIVYMFRVLGYIVLARMIPASAH
jgi:glycosyltransferase involved in cell wall biosynthesis